MSILAKTVSGAGWVVGFRMVTRLLGIVGARCTLAHLLGPSDFGLVALASGFAQTVDAVTNLSVHEAIIRERAPERAMYDTAFTMSLIRGLLTGGIVVATAWPVADFFHEPRLAIVLLALAASNLIGAVENIATADFMRTFAFRREFQLWTIPRVLQVIATISFALIWPSYWALVFGIVLGRVLRTGLSYAMVPYLPRLTLTAWRRIIGFTTWSWATYIFVILRDRIDTLLIGRLFSAGQVGIYALGGEIASLPTSELVDPLCRACFPSFSQIRHEGLITDAGSSDPFVSRHRSAIIPAPVGMTEELELSPSGMRIGQTYVRLFGAAAMIVLPAGVGIAAVADPLVKLAFGLRWVEAIPMIQILGITATLSVIGSLSGTLFSAYGMLRTTFTITAVTTVLRAGLLLAFLPGGTLVTAAIVVAVVVSVEQCAYIVVTLRRFKIKASELLRAVHRSLAATLVMAGGLVWLGLGFTSVPQGFAIHLIANVATGAAIYVAVLAVAWWAAGRPIGPERDLLNVLGRIGRHLGARLSLLATRRRMGS